MNLCHLVAFNHFMPVGLRHGLNRGINREWHKMPTLLCRLNSEPGGSDNEQSSHQQSSNEEDEEEPEMSAALRRRLAKVRRPQNGSSYSQPS